jgi:CDP-paratose 2-epimerase
MIGAVPIRQADNQSSEQHNAHILITGGAGFLGTNIADTLAARGDNVLIFDNLSRAHVRDNLAWLKARHPGRISAMIADVRDAPALAEAVEGARAVIHLAAQVAVTSSVVNPVEDFEINARGTLNLLEAVRHGAPAAPILFASTNKVYGKLLNDDAFARAGSRYAPRQDRIAAGFGEDTPLQLYSPYGCSKGAADQYVLDYARIFGLKTAVLRMSCLYGPHQYGSEDQGWVAHFMIRAHKGQPIALYGDGYQVRDILYVDDAVRAYLLCLDRIAEIAGRAFNLGGGPHNAISLHELLARIERIEGAGPQVTLHDWRPGDQLWYVSNTDAITAATGWRAAIGVADGLERLHAWIADRFGAPRTEAVA